MSQALRDVARRIRYLELPELIGASITVESIDTAWGDLHTGITQIVPREFLPLPGTPQFHPGAVAKYGVFDIEYTIDDALVTGGRSGLRLLEELGFLVRGDKGDEFLEQFREEVVPGKAYLKLFCDTRLQGESRIARTTRVPEAYFPREAKIIDACASNWDFVWFCRHFYL